MTPKAKAEELLDKLYSVKDDNNISSMKISLAKQCALICVEEIIKSYETDFTFWQEVKTEIEKL